VARASDRLDATASDTDSRLELHCAKLQSHLDLEVMARTTSPTCQAMMRISLGSACNGERAVSSAEMDELSASEKTGIFEILHAVVSSTPATSRRCCTR